MVQIFSFSHISKLYLLINTFNFLPVQPKFIRGNLNEWMSDESIEYITTSNNTFASTLVNSYPLSHANIWWTIFDK